MTYLRRSPIRIYVLAGNIQQYDFWRGQSGIKRDEAVYVSHPDAFRGLRDIRVVIVGTFNDREDAREFREQLYLTNADITHAP